MIAKFRSMVRSALRGGGQFIFMPLVLALGRRPSTEEVPVSVHLLVSSKTWRMGILAAWSLEFFSGKRWRLFVHEDGSLDEGAISEVHRKLPGVRFVVRHEADAAVSKYWNGQPACLRHRQKHNLFLKFFDPVVFAPAEKFMILDADLFFYRKPADLLEWATGRTGGCFYNRDVKEVYALDRDKIEEATGVRLWENFNSGLVGVCKTAINQELSEKLLAKCENQAPHPQFFEQTLYALCCSAYGRGGALPSQYEITWNIFRRADSVCRHYVGPAKWDHLYFEGPPTLFWRMTLPSLLGKNFSK